MAAVVVTAAAAGFLAAAWTARVPVRHVPRIVATDMNGDLVTLDGASPAPSTSALPATPGRGARLIARTVGLDVALGAIDMVDGEITPPGFRSAYLVGNLGVPPDRAAEGTVFVVMHALRGGGRGPGNYLTDIATGASTLHPGDQIEVAGLRYRVTGWRAIGKRALATAPDVWAGVPDRLIVITCLERPDGSASRRNLVIWATRLPPPQ